MIDAKLLMQNEKRELGRAVLGQWQGKRRFSSFLIFTF
jgi:hypothetical protein